MTATDPEAVSLVSSRNSLGETINEMAYGNQRRIISKNGKQVASLISIDKFFAGKRIELPQPQAGVLDGSPVEFCESITLLQHTIN